MNITVANLTKSYGKKRVIKDISFFLNPGDIMAIAGANGSGKTTLLKMLALVTKQDNGEYLLDGVPAYKQNISVAYVPQQITAFLELTVYDNLKYWLKKGNEKSLTSTILSLNLEPYLYTRARNLSGGYLRRLNLATALINKPNLLIMDEPLTGVDINTRLSFKTWMSELSGNGVNIIYTTHHSDEISGIANKLGIIYNGGLKFIPDISDLFLDNLISRFIELNA